MYRVELVGAAGRSVGTITVEEERGDLRLGRASLEDFDPATGELFREYDAAANGGMLPEVDRLEKLIASRAFAVKLPNSASLTPVFDFQVYEDGGASFRVKR